MRATIIDQINKFLISLFDFELDLKNSGSTRIKTVAIITIQIKEFLKNIFDFEFDLKNSGKTRIKTAIKKIAGIISSNPIF